MVNLIEGFGEVQDHRVNLVFMVQTISKVREGSNQLCYAASSFSKSMLVVV